MATDKKVSELPEETTPATADKLLLVNASDATKSYYVTYGNAIETPLSGKGYEYYLVVGTDSDSDYVCDGVADEVQINAAITALSTTGGIIYIKQGTYNLADNLNVVSDYDHISIIGAGADTTILKLAANTTMTRLADQLPMLYCGGSYCSFKNFTLNGNKTNQTQDYQLGIFSNSQSNLLIDNVKLLNNGYRAIYLSSVTYSIIQNCYISACGDRGFELETSENNKIINNTVINPVSHGIQLDTSSVNNIVANNRISGAGNFSIGVDSNSHENLIQGNMISNSFDEGVQITNSKFCKVIGNIIDTVTDDFGISVESRTTNNCDCTQIQDNFIASSDNSGIALLGTRWAVCTGNTLYRTNVGGHANVGAIFTDSTATVNTIANNIIVDDRTPKLHTWSILEGGGGDYNIITGNQCDGYLTAAVSTVGASTLSQNNINEDKSWQAYTPTLTWTQGNGTIAGRYVRHRDTVHFAVKIVLGSTSTMNAGQHAIGLPTTSANNGVNYIFSGYMKKGGTLYYIGSACAPNSSTAPFGQISNNTFWESGLATWAAADEIYLSGTYETA